MSVVLWLPVPTFWQEQYLTCPQCRGAVPARSNYCVFCGALLNPSQVWTHASKVCDRCEKRIPLWVKFCPECGLKQ